MNHSVSMEGSFNNFTNFQQSNDTSNKDLQEYEQALEKKKGRN